MTGPVRIRLEQLADYLQPTPIGSQGVIRDRRSIPPHRPVPQRGPHGGKLKIKTVEPRPEGLKAAGRKRKDSADIAVVVELVPNKAGVRNKLPEMTPEEKRQWNRLQERRSYAKRIANETPEETEARRAKTRAANAKRAHKRALQAFRELQAEQGDRIGQAIVKMRESHEAAIAFARENGDLFTVAEMQRPYAPNFARLPNIAERIMRAGELVWRLDVQIRHGWASRPWNGFTPGFAVSLTGRVQNFRPGTAPPVCNFTGDRMLDWREDRR